jgi:predicted AlkP superfamily phosphohydrolase/phosphomutase
MRTLIIGLDAFDPAFFERLHSKGKTPHLSKLLEAGGYSRFRVSDPPQSEVSWTSIATGMNPGGHGMFDFVHRNPANYSLQVSLLPTQKNLLGLQFVPPYNARTIFDEAVEDGYPATSMWWPATFPAKLASPVQTIPGLGTPDILGRLGVGTYFSIEGLPADPERKTAVRSLVKKGATKFTGTLEGPAKKNRNVNIDFELEVNDNTATLQVAKQKVMLKPGEWGEIVELPFSVGFGMTVKAISRAILTNLDPVSIYFLPLQLHPLGSPWPYATPKDFIQDQWKKNGPFLTLGWPQDTTALNENLINDEQFLKLCEMIDAERERVLKHSLDSFDEGLLACVFDSLDRVQHMFFKGREDVIEAWYIRLDAMIGRIMERAARRKTKVVIVSDHGFGRFDYKVHLNKWLLERGYLKTTNPASSDLRAVDWSQTQAYALGLNSLYLNLAGREGQGIVQDAAQILAKLKEDLLQWKGPNGEAVVQSALIREEVFQGPLAAYGPDIFIGYRPPYRGSAETGLGQWRSEAIEKNTEHWEADHCFDSRAVPGVIFSNEGLGNFPSPSYRDIPALTIGRDLKTQASAPPPKYSDEDQDEIEKRLKDLGYL